MIHQYKNNGYNIVLDVNSGSVHVVDDLVYDAIPLVEEVLRSGVPESETLAAAILTHAMQLWKRNCCRKSIKWGLGHKD